MRSMSAKLVAAIFAISCAAPAHAGHHGDAVVTGAAGFAIGTLFGAAVSQPRYVAPAPVYVVPEAPPVVYQPVPVYYGPPPAWTPEWYQYCADRYRSFDARSGTIVGYDGYRHMCQ